MGRPQATRSAHNISVLALVAAHGCPIPSSTFWCLTSSLGGHRSFQYICEKELENPSPVFLYARCSLIERAMYRVLRAKNLGASHA